ncbi:MAG: helix-turn-helix transcriptional regulator [Hyphomicrobium sp.]|uniref:helix-turn-helix domain-containing protein n=1 Tax=Hyphomicrobium sp. TaxID=82 RepID=UPI0035699BEF
MAPVPKKPRERNRTFMREWRDFRRLSQEEVADKLDIDRSTISRIERGESPYDQDILERLALVYRCDPEDLLAINPFGENKLHIAYSDLRRAPAEIQARAVGYIEAILKAG